MKKNVAGIALSLCCLIAAAHPSPGNAGGGEKSEDGARLLAVGDLAPDWKLSDPDGRTHSLSEYRGRVVVLDFWATWCAPCAKVMPRMEKLHRKYKDQGVAVFGLSSWETGDPTAVMKKKNCTYGLLLKGEEVAPLYGVAILPSVCVIGVDGKVIYSHTGADHQNLDALIKEHLKARGT
ncbi:MAG TPA: TlpA disulfide reductase family protein [Pyrinomonadaceae bacterium]|nr:TlpA disulfide reductase family protein [Pyrinomonadaceae bacterium]